MVHELTRVDQDLWDRFMALDEATLQAALGKWLGDGQIRAILARRDEMTKDIEALVAEWGEDAVNGEEVWHISAGGSVNAAPISYAVDGRQYVTIQAGNVLLAFGSEDESQ